MKKTASVLLTLVGTFWVSGAALTVLLWVTGNVPPRYEYVLEVLWIVIVLAGAFLWAGFVLWMERWRMLAGTVLIVNSVIFGGMAIQLARFPDEFAGSRSPEMWQHVGNITPFVAGLFFVAGAMLLAAQVRRTKAALQTPEKGANNSQAKSD